ncbi:MAG: hypothetical protein ACTSVI_08705 [Promethearchaeota archaeon]
MSFKSTTWGELKNATFFFLFFYHSKELPVPIKNKKVLLAHFNWFKIMALKRVQTRGKK